MNNFYFIGIAIAVIIYVFVVVKRKCFSIKESFWWIVASFLMLILAIFPYLIDFIAKKMGVFYPPSLLFVMCIIFLLFILFRNSKKIYELQLKTMELGQELAILKEKVNYDKKK